MYLLNFYLIIIALARQYELTIEFLLTPADNITLYSLVHNILLLIKKYKYIYSYKLCVCVLVIVVQGCSLTDFKELNYI